jgi:hypothetical protein
MGFFDEVNTFLKNLLRDIAMTLRRFVAYSMFLFFLGTVYYHFLVVTGQPQVYMFIPLILAALAYFSTEIAALLFILILLVSIVFFTFI